MGESAGDCGLHPVVSEIRCSDVPLMHPSTLNCPKAQSAKPSAIKPLNLKA